MVLILISAVCAGSSGFAFAFTVILLEYFVSAFLFFTDTVNLLGFPVTGVIAKSGLSVVTSKFPDVFSGYGRMVSSES